MMKTIVHAGLLAAVLAGVALADPILLTFAGPGIGLPGSVVTLTATAVNTSGVDQTLDGIGLTLGSPFVTFDDSPFFTIWPLSLDAAGPGSQFGPEALFTVTIPVGTADGLYSGTVLNLMGGGGGLLLTSATFDIEVTSAVPEPATTGLLALGLTALTLLRGRRRIS